MSESKNVPSGVIFAAWFLLLLHIGCEAGRSAGLENRIRQLESKQRANE